MQGYDVWWDGTKNGLNGGLINVPAEARQIAELPKPRTPDQDRRGLVRRALEQGPHTATELASLTGLTPYDVNAALYGMRQRGEVAVIGTQRRTSRAYGFSEVQVYALVGR